MTLNIKSEISQQPQVGYFLNLKLKLMRPNQTLEMFKIEMTSYGSRVEYLSNHLLDQ